MSYDFFIFLKNCFKFGIENENKVFHGQKLADEMFLNCAYFVILTKFSLFIKFQITSRPFALEQPCFIDGAKFEI